EAVLRKLEGQVDVVTASDFLAAHPPRSTIRLPEGSWGQGGHHWVWLNDGTRWIWEDVYRAEDAFLDVLRATRSRKDPTVRRIVAQLARELLLLEASDWPFLITTVAAKDYAEARVKEHIGPERIEGTNWTDAVLRTYGRMGSVLQRSSGSASVDIEPQTLAWLLERDPSAYRAIMSAYDQGIAGFVMTPPFHPILPHLHRQEREALFDMMIDFYSPLIQRSKGRPIGLWLPEAAYSRETMDSFRESARRAGVEREAIADSIQTPYLIVDARQFARPPQPGQAWARVESTERLMAVGRDHPLSGEFAFGATTAPEFAASVRSRGSGSLLVANDLESLLANPMQAERFEAIVHTLREGAVQVIPPVPPGDAPPLALVDYSSWSDYDDMLSGGITSDTRWTGLRRSDGLVASRIHRGRPLSQLWKYAFTLATERVETAVRRRALYLLRSAGVPRRPHALRRLAVSYGRHWF